MGRHYRRRSDAHVAGAYRVPSVLFAALLSSFPLSAAAQPGPEGHLVGTVRDATGLVIPGAIVALRSNQLIGGPREVIVGASGSWRAPAIPPGEYTASATAPGFKRTERAGILLAPGQTIVIDFVLEIGRVTESAFVDAPPPVVDVRTTAISFHLPEGLLRDLPTSRNVAELINLMPGVAGDTSFGGTKASNGIYVDGIDTTEPSEQGPWLRFNQNWVQEVQVVGIGSDAEHGKSTGVNAYVIVRPGTNRYAGLAEYWTTERGWLASNTEKLSETLQKGFAPARTASYWDVNGQMGGPLRRDRVWLFAGFEHVDDDRAPAGYDGPLLQETRESSGIGKLTIAAGHRWRLDGLIHGSRHRSENLGLGPLVAPEATGRLRRPQVSWNSRASGQIGSAVLVEARYGGYDSSRVLRPRDEATPGHYDLLTGYLSVNRLEASRDGRTRHAAAGSVTVFTRSGPGHAHEVKAGLELEDATEHTTSWFPGGQVYYDIGSEPYLRDTFEGVDARGETRRFTVYAQNRWQVSDRLTLLPGVRVDLFRASTTAARDLFRTNPVSPRVGVAWEVPGRSQTVLRAHYGRYTDPVFAQPIMLTDSHKPSLLITETIDATGLWQEISRRDLAAHRRVGEEIRHSHVDQFLLGLERQLARDVSVQAHYLQRRFGNFMGFVANGADWVPVERKDPGPDGLPGTPDDGPVFAAYSLTNLANVMFVYSNPQDAWRRYDAVQVIGRKRDSNRWGLQVSYTWSRTRGTIGNGFHTNAGRGDLGQLGAGNPNRRINGDERSPHDPTNEAKLFGSWRPTQLGGFTFSGVYRYMTGSAWGRTFVATGLGQGVEQILAEPRGTRRVDAIKNLDLRLEKTVALRGNRRLGVFGDVFNVLNQGVPDSDWPIPVLTTSGPALGMPVAWRPARQLRLAARLFF